MSYLSTLVLSTLEEIFPANPHRRIFLEQYVKYKGARLFFDFYIKELGVYIECQGRQHTEYVKHFHGDKDTFLKQKHRDNLKIEYVQENDKALVRINHDEEVTKELLLEKIKKAMENTFYE